MGYVEDIINHTPTFEFLTWLLTLGSMGYTMHRTYLVLKAAQKHSGPIKRSPVFRNRIARNGGRSILTPLAKLQLAEVGRTMGRFPTPILYWVSTLQHRWGKPAWEGRWSLPVPTIRTGFWRVVTKVDVGRVNRPRAVAVLLAVGIEFFLYGVVKTLGNQYGLIGVRERGRLVEGGAYKVVRHPMYSGAIAAQFAWAVAFWSWLPIYILPIYIISYLVKIPIEEEIMEEDPELGPRYTAYKMRVPWRLIPYVW